MADAPKVVILAGGLGTRLSEETQRIPKPMVEVGGRPILWHIMKHFAHYGFDEFIVALGYRGDVVKKFFLDYTRLCGSLKVDLGSGAVELYDGPRETWTVHLVDTGLETNTGGRVKQLEPLLGGRTFFLTYGDGVSDLDLRELLAFHRAHGRPATITAVRPPARFGAITFRDDRLAEFTEKSQLGEGWINGGFMVLEPAVLASLDGGSSSLEVNALQPLAQRGQLCAFRHERFWQCMDTLRDVRHLEELWQSSAPPWRVWR